MSRIIFHIDANNAYLSWEAVYRLQHGESIDLRQIPSVVGGDPKKRSGIVLAKSNPAKKYGITTGETLFSAFKKCPNLVVVPPNYPLYIKCSNAMVEILKDYSPQIQRYSIDECFLDFSGMKHLHESPFEIAEDIRRRIKNELGFTVSIGVSSNKLLAKMGGELKKPDAVSTLWPSELSEKLWPLPVEDLFMVGRATLPKLRKMSIYTIGDLAKYDPKYLQYTLKSHGQVIWNFANGIEASSVKKSTHLVAKGIGNSTTISFDVETSKEAHLILLSLTETVAMRLRDSGLCAMLVSVSIKTSTFEHYSHQRKFYTPTDTTKQIFAYVKMLFDEIWKGEPIRHLGVRVSELCDNDFVQISIFDEEVSDKQKSLDKVIDQLRLKYDSKIITKCCFLHSGIKPLSGGISEEDYPLMSSQL